MGNRALYTIIFNDGSSFVGGSLQQTKWLDIPNKPIKRVVYSLPVGDFLVLQDYEHYYNMIEAVSDINGQNKGKQIIEYAYIMGKIKDLVICYKIHLKNQIGSIEKNYYSIDDPFIKGLSEQGWK